jgi:hypothetical protein
MVVPDISSSTMLLIQSGSTFGQVRQVDCRHCSPRWRRAIHLLKVIAVLNVRTGLHSGNSLEHTQAVISLPSGLQEV